MSKTSTCCVGRLTAETSTKPKRRYRVDYIIFDKGLPLPPEEFKKGIRTERKISKAKFDELFEIVYVRSVINKRKKTHTLVICKKADANGMFIIPKNHRKGAKGAIEEFDLLKNIKK